MITASEIDFGEPSFESEEAPVDDSIVVAERLPAFIARLRETIHPPDIIPLLVPGAGITMPHGQPRSLKTWFGLECACAASSADAAFGLERFRVTRPIETWYLTEEDPEIEIRDRLECLFTGRGASAYPANFHLSVQRLIQLDDPQWQHPRSATRAPRGSSS